MCCEDKKRRHHAERTAHDDHHAGMVPGTCGCGCGGRKFLSKKEKIEMLEEYKESLKSELVGVEEALKMLREV